MRSARRLLAVAGLLAATAPGAFAQRPDAQEFDTLERGRYLATVGDCVACHTVPGGIPYAGGRAIETPFGTIVTPNLTPDPATGIGSWTDAEFYRAMHDGVGRGGEHLYPAFPYPYYTRVTREDTRDIRAFLNTLDPVRNPVERNQLPFPFNIRASLIGWNALFFDKGEWQPHADKSPQWNRGGYLIEGLAHCGACHTPKNLAGGDQTAQYMQGYDLQGWYAPNLTGDPHAGLGGWSADAIVEYLKTGRNEFHTASGPMAEVITHTTSLMTNDDLADMAAYLKDLPAPPVFTPAPLAGTDPAMQAGEALYVDNCAACHTKGGDGIARLFPSLRNAPSVTGASATSAIRVVLQGTRAVATDMAPTGPAMPAFGWRLSDAQVAAVLTYTRNAWGNAAPAVSTGSVSTLRQSLRQRAE